MHAQYASAWPIERAVWQRLRSVYIHEMEAVFIYTVASIGLSVDRGTAQSATSHKLSTSYSTVL